MHHSINWKTGLLLFGVCIFAASMPATAAIYFSTPQHLTDDTYVDLYQQNPDVDFDVNGDVHCVWSELREVDPQIFHRKFNRLGPMTDSQPAMLNYGLTQPEISFMPFYNVVRGHCLATGPSFFEVFASELDLGGNTWINIDPTGVMDVYTPDFAMQGYSNTMYGYILLAATDFSSVDFGIRFMRYDVIFGSGWDQTFTEPPGDYERLHNVHLDVDDDGYIYAVCDAEDVTGYTHVIAFRSGIPHDFTGSFMPFRIVGNISYDSNPRIDVRQFGTEKRVCIVWSNGTTIECATEINGNWSSESPLPPSVTVTDPFSSSPSTPDVAIGADGEIYVAWLDARIGATANCIVSISYDNGATFLPNQAITQFTQPNAAISPRFAASPLNNDIALTYGTFEEDIFPDFNTYLATNVAQFWDPCENFDNWDNNQGVVVSTESPHDPGGRSFKFSNTDCVLSKHYATNDTTGSFQFWFKDEMSNNVNFDGGIYGDDGTKTPLYQVVGVRNETSSSQYSVNVSELKGWAPTGRERQQGWHHVIINVSAEGTEMFLDPQDDPIPVWQSTATMSFNRLEFTGGNPLSTDSYFVDDIRVVADERLSVPATHPAGLALLILAFMALLGKRFCKSKP